MRKGLVCFGKAQPRAKDNTRLQPAVIKPAKDQMKKAMPIGFPANAVLGWLWGEACVVGIAEREKGGRKGKEDKRSRGEGTKDRGLEGGEHGQKKGGD